MHAADSNAAAERKGNSDEVAIAQPIALAHGIQPENSLILHAWRQLVEQPIRPKHISRGDQRLRPEDDLIRLSIENQAVHGGRTRQAQISLRAYFQAEFSIALHRDLALRVRVRRFEAWKLRLRVWYWGELERLFDHQGCI